MIKIADRDRGPRPYVIVNVFFEETASSGVGMILKVPSNPVESVARAIRKEPGTRIQEKPRCLRGRTAKHDQVGTLELYPTVWIEIADALCPPALVQGDLTGRTLDAQLTVAGGQCFRDHRVVSPIFGVDLASIAAAVAAADAGGPAPKRDRIAEHGNMKGMEP